jgi:hypothetical protein
VTKPSFTTHRRRAAVPETKFRWLKSFQNSKTSHVISSHVVFARALSSLPGGEEERGLVFKNSQFEKRKKKRRKRRKKKVKEKKTLP